MKQEIKIGVTDRTVLVFIPDPASTDGSGKTGLTAAALTVSYTRVETDNDVVCVDASSSLSDLSALTDAHADWGLKEVNSTLQPGLYRLDLADAVFAAGAWSAVVYAMITTSAAAASPMEFILVAYDPLDTVRLGLTALPNAAAEASGGLPTLSAAQASNGTINANVHRWLTGTPNALQSGRVDGYLGAVASGAIAAASFAANALDAVWSTAARLLTAGTNIVLAKGVGVTGFTDIDAAGVRTAVGLASANLDTQLDALPTAAENAAALMDLANGVETGLTPRQALRLIAAALAGKLSGAATTTVVIRNAAADSKDRITTTVDASGNRLGVTLDVT